jgi:hypothetical protein
LPSPLDRSLVTRYCRAARTTVDPHPLSQPPQEQREEAICIRLHLADKAPINKPRRLSRSGPRQLA